VDGLASYYVADDSRLRPTAILRSAADRRRALELVSFRLPDSAFHPSSPGSSAGPLTNLGRRLRRLAGDERTNYLWSTRNDKVMLAGVLEHFNAAGPAGMAVHELRACHGSSAVQFDWIVLQLIRYGVLEIVNGEAPAGSTGAGVGE
jgi:hypothetical protein